MTARHKFRGFRPASDLLRDRVRGVAETRGFAVSRLLTHWAEVAGPELAAVARPVDVTFPRGALGATLTVLVEGAHAPMVEMRREALRERVNACYGYAAIARIRVTQTAPTGFAEGKIDFDHAPARTAAPSRAAVEAGLEAAQGVRDDGLRAALARLAANVITPRPDRGPT
ncbi:MAG: DUF721 domain-containing protein [Paracoccaceae bacterium]